MVHFYKVAGHLFSVSMDDNCSLETQMDNYEPFRVEQGGDPIFSLGVSDSLDITGARPVYIDDKGEEDMARIDIYRIDDDWLIQMSPNKRCPICANLRIKSDHTSGILHTWKYESFALNNALMLIYAFRTARESTLEMHSSVIVRNGRGYMFLGKSGTGKSTHSSLWMKNLTGCRLLNDDNPILRIIDGKAVVFGSPWSGKTPCYKNESAEVGAIVDLSQYPRNEIEKVSPFTAYAALYSSCSGFRADKEMADALHATMEKVILKVPFYHLNCLPDKEAAELCSSVVEK